MGVAQALKRDLLSLSSGQSLRRYSRPCEQLARPPTAETCKGSIRIKLWSFSLVGPHRVAKSPGGEAGASVFKAVHVRTVYSADSLMMVLVETRLPAVSIAAGDVR